MEIALTIFFLHLTWIHHLGNMLYSMDIWYILMSPWTDKSCTFVIEVTQIKSFLNPIIIYFYIQSSPPTSVKINLRTSGVKQKTPKQQQKPTPLPLNNYKNKGMTAFVSRTWCKRHYSILFSFPWKSSWNHSYSGSECVSKAITPTHS